MKITINCTGRDNDALCGLSDEELATWLLAEALKAMGHIARYRYQILDSNGNTVATVTLDSEGGDDAQV